MVRVSKEELQGRLTAVRQSLTTWQVDAILIGSEVNRRWLSGFRGSSGWLFVSQEKAQLGTDFRYWDQAQQQSPLFNLVRFKGTPEENFQQLLAPVGQGRVAIESKQMSVHFFDWLGETLDEIQWHKIEESIDHLRRVKSTSELEHIRTAAAITDQAMAQVPQLVQVGMSERQLTWELEKTMRALGATGLAFPPIVAFGSNSGHAHHEPGERPLQIGDIIIVDMGAELNGYKSDLTRTFFVGQPTDGRFQTIYDIVHQAEQTAINNLKGGLTGIEIDRLGREVIEQAGYGEQFGHPIGHNVGLEIHEEPIMSLRCEEVIEAGAVLTIEPGIYLSGWGGIRLEDLLLVGETGAQRLSHCPKEPFIPVDTSE